MVEANQPFSRPQKPPIFHAVLMKFLCKKSQESFSGRPEKSLTLRHQIPSPLFKSLLVGGENAIHHDIDRRKKATD
jgi:hypothetical protein